MGAVEERSHDAVATAWDGREARGTGAADGVHKEGLGAVVGIVRRDDASGRAGASQLVGELVCKAGGSGVAQLAAGVLDVVTMGRGKRRDVCADDRAGDAIAVGQLADVLLVLLGVEAAQLVVHVQDVQALARDAGVAAAVIDVERGVGGKPQQGRGVGTTRDHEDDGRRARRVAALVGSLERASARISPGYGRHGLLTCLRGALPHLAREDTPPARYGPTTRS